MEREGDERRRKARGGRQGERGRDRMIVKSRNGKWGKTPYLHFAQGYNDNISLPVHKSKETTFY